MPEMTGVELAKEILTLQPGLPIIMCTGFSYVVDADKAKAGGHQGFCDEAFDQTGDSKDD
ncbi:MAG: hypothetical protein ABSC19_21350 [Syntrophorhabdales bacterium]|jgi:FixJ family two-component response regulator